MRTHVRYMFIRIRDTDVHLKARDYCLMVDRNQYNQSAWAMGLGGCQVIVVLVVSLLFVMLIKTVGPISLLFAGNCNVSAIRACVSDRRGQTLSCKSRPSGRSQNSREVCGARSRSCCKFA